MANIHDMKVKVGVPKPRDMSENKLPGLSYIPDKIEVAEDKVLMDKVSRELLDFIRMLTQLLDLMYIIKTKNLRATNPIPHAVIRELFSKNGRGTLYKAYNKPNPIASPSVEMAVKQQSALHPPKRHLSRQGDQVKPFPFANDLVTITGRKTRPMWQTVLIEKPEEIKLLKKPERVVANSAESRMYTQCKQHPGTDRKPSELDLFSIKFVMARSLDVIANPDEKLFRQMEMMLASNEGFRTVEDHKVYLLSLQSHWYTNFVKDALKIGVVTCSDIIKALELLARHYDMNYNSLPFAKAKLCLIVMSLPFWDIVRPETQRAVEFILENILLLAGKPLIDWLRVRNVPYVVFPPYSQDDFHYRPEDDSSETMADNIESKQEVLDTDYSVMTIN